MMHLYIFLSVVVVLATYASLTYRFWLKKSKTSDAIDAIILSILTTLAVMSVVGLGAVIWQVTS
jgi:hypothetical protein